MLVGLYIVKSYLNPSNLMMVCNALVVLSDILLHTWVVYVNVHCKLVYMDSWSVLKLFQKSVLSIRTLNEKKIIRSYFLNVLWIPQLPQENISANMNTKERIEKWNIKSHTFVKEGLKFKQHLSWLVVGFLYFLGRGRVNG